MAKNSIETAKATDGRGAPDRTTPAAQNAARLEEKIRETDDAAADGRALYTVTELAGPKVAGQRVKLNQELRLTEAEARVDLLNGAIVPKGKGLPKGLRREAEKGSGTDENAAD